MKKNGGSVEINSQIFLYLNLCKINFLHVNQRIWSKILYQKTHQLGIYSIINIIIYLFLKYPFYNHILQGNLIHIGKYILQL